MPTVSVSMAEKTLYIFPANMAAIPPAIPPKLVLLAATAAAEPKDAQLMTETLLPVEPTTPPA